jgi:hypothetical protein
MDLQTVAYLLGDLCLFLCAGRCENHPGNHVMVRVSLTACDLVGIQHPV